MSSRDNETPDEAAVTSDFSTPADADFTTPGNPIQSEEHLEELDEAQATRRPETPGDPLHDDGLEETNRRSSPGDPLNPLDDVRGDRRNATPGEPLEER